MYTKFHAAVIRAAVVVSKLHFAKYILTKNTSYKVSKVNLRKKDNSVETESS